SAPWIPAERVSRQVLLAAYTLGGAYLNHRENETGSLEVGKAADFVIVDRNPLTVPVRDIGGATVLHTIVDGEGGFPSPRSGAPGQKPIPTRGRPATRRRASPAMPRMHVMWFTSETAKGSEGGVSDGAKSRAQRSGLRSRTGAEARGR